MSDPNEEQTLSGAGANISADRNHANGDNEESTRMCRDYIRGVCDRPFCKYKHEKITKTLSFCHDYQNNVCPRSNCKFIHCSIEDEIEFRRSGVLNAKILSDATRKNLVQYSPPICNQFRNTGQCKRINCKFRHITKEQEHNSDIKELLKSRKRSIIIDQNHTERTHLQQPLKEYFHLSPNGIHLKCLNDGSENRTLIAPLSSENTTAFAALQAPQILDADLNCVTIGSSSLTKRCLLGSSTSPLHNHNNTEALALGSTVFKGYFAGHPPAPILTSHIDGRAILLEEENNLLHKEIAQLKRQVSDLTATNEFLLDQNANLRLSTKQRVSSAGTANDVVQSSQPTTTQMIRTVTASVATVPVSLATVSTCNPVSVSIAGVPTVSMAPPSAAATAQLLAAPSQQILVTTTTNPTTAPHLMAAAAAATQPTAAAAAHHHQLALATAAASQHQLHQLNAVPQIALPAQLVATATATQGQSSQPPPQQTQSAQSQVGVGAVTASTAPPPTEALLVSYPVKVSH